MYGNQNSKSTNQFDLIVGTPPTYTESSDYMNRRSGMEQLGMTKEDSRTANDKTGESTEQRCPIETRLTKLVNAALPRELPKHLPKPQVCVNKPEHMATEGLKKLHSPMAYIPPTEGTVKYSYQMRQPFSVISNTTHDAEIFNIGEHPSIDQRNAGILQHDGSGEMKANIKVYPQNCYPQDLKTKQQTKAIKVMENRVEQVNELSGEEAVNKRIVQFMDTRPIRLTVPSNNELDESEAMKLPEYNNNKALGKYKLSREDIQIRLEKRNLGDVSPTRTHIIHPKLTYSERVAEESYPAVTVKHGTADNAGSVGVTAENRRVCFSKPHTAMVDPTFTGSKGANGSDHAVTNMRVQPSKTLHVIEKVHECESMSNYCPARSTITGSGRTDSTNKTNNLEDSSSEASSDLYENENSLNNELDDKEDDLLDGNEEDLIVLPGETPKSNRGMWNQKSGISLTDFKQRKDLKIDWSDISMPPKTDIITQVYRRFINYKNTDLRICIDNEFFNCHSQILKIYSEFFQEYEGEPLVVLPADKVNGDAFAVIYEWMLNVNDDSAEGFERDNILDILIACQYLRIPELEEICWALFDDFHEDLALMIGLDAMARGLSDIMNMLLPRVNFFFLPLVATEDFLKLDIDALENLLHSSYIRVHSEFEVFMAAVHWLTYKWPDRCQFCELVMSSIRFGYCSPIELVDIQRNPVNPEFIITTKGEQTTRRISEGLAVAVNRERYNPNSTAFHDWLISAEITLQPERAWLKERVYDSFQDFMFYLSTLPPWPLSKEVLETEVMPLEAACYDAQVDASVVHFQTVIASDISTESTTSTSQPSTEARRY